MPLRVSHTSVSTLKPYSSRKKNQKRTLEALSIASHQHPERHKIRQHRLGEAEDDNPRRKRQRLQDEFSDEDDDDELSNARRMQQKKDGKSTSGRGRFDELDVSEGSDSEGNHWTLGHVGDDDDESLDSDEAFGESDEERFEGFTFRGSSGGKGDRKKRKEKPREVDEEGPIDLNEEEVGQKDEEDSLGSDAVDLADMLDESGDEEVNAVTGHVRKAAADGKAGDDVMDEELGSDQEGAQESTSEDGDEDRSSGLDEDDDATDFSVSEPDEEESDPTKLSELQDLISSLPADEGVRARGPRPLDVHESRAPSSFDITPSRKISLASALATSSDPEVKRSLKTLARSTKSSGKDGIGKLEARLPKRQQDRLDRIAANQKAKETLDRWVDTVKHNRRAEHISFPLRNPDESEPQGAKRLMPTSSSAPLSNLESTIQSILQESGLATIDGKSEEDQIRAFEELKTNKMPLEEVQARRAELRKARELLFREEVRAKRIKKIKSKAYRRVHRKERDRAAQHEREALAEAGIDVSEDERERNDRRRAEERMGARHRESKWAKGIKETGRAAWDEDARDGVTEMARRNEELRKRIEGKKVRDQESDNDTSHGDEDDEDDDEPDLEDDDVAESRRLQRQLARINGGASVDDSASKLGSMAFMQRAEAARRAQNDEDATRLARELAGEDSSSEGDDEEQGRTFSGRRKYGPASKNPFSMPAPRPRNEFEEGPESGDEVNEEEDEVKIVLDGHSSKQGQGRQSLTSSTQVSKKKQQPAAYEDSAETANPWLDTKTNARSLKKGREGVIETSNPWVNGSSHPKPPNRSNATGLKPQSKRRRTAAAAAAAAGAEAPAPGDTNGWTTVTSRNDDDQGHDSNMDSDDASAGKPIVMGNSDLIRQAFAGDEVTAAFEAEKKATIASEDDKVVDNTLPGWGSWTGEGVSKREAARNKGRFTTTITGVKPEARKDAKLEKVIISHARVKKNMKYLASALPHPFETKGQYEGSLRMAIGPEFTTKEVFQGRTMPRVLVKPGRIIAPMERPLL